MRLSSIRSKIFAATEVSAIGRYEDSSDGFPVGFRIGTISDSVQVSGIFPVVQMLLCLGADLCCYCPVLGSYGG